MAATPTTRNRRGLVGLPETARPSTTPIEVPSFALDGVTHKASKQTWAGCVGGIDNWRLETHCGLKVMVTALARRGGDPNCMACIVMSL